MAGEVIDLLQDLGLPLPQSREIHSPLQMENKLPFKHTKREENDGEPGEGSRDERRRGNMGRSLDRDTKQPGLSSLSNK